MPTSQTFDWIPFYQEFADILLTYKDRKGELLKILDEIPDELKLAGKNRVIDDVCPFIIFALFNRTTAFEHRLELLQNIKSQFHVTSPLPTNLDGVPVLSRSDWWYFYEHAMEKRGKDDISKHWELFEAAILYADNPVDKNKEIFLERYNIAKEQNDSKLIRILTCGLFWIRPEKYLSLDGITYSHIRNLYLFQSITPYKHTGEEYFEFMNVISEYLESPNLPYHTFYELSNYASNIQKEQQNKKIWLYTLNNSVSSWEMLFNNGKIEMANNSLEFILSMKIGDIIVAKTGAGQLIGRGIVKSDRHYDEIPQYRYVEWTQRKMDSAIDIKFPEKKLIRLQPDQNFYPLCIQYLKSIEESNNVGGGHYIQRIEHYLQSKGFQYTANLSFGIQERKGGKVFSIADHVKGMIYSLLSNQREWATVSANLSQIDAIFYNYDVERILKTNPAYFISEIKKIKCGNRAIKRQMEYLADNIKIFKTIESEYGSVDIFITSKPAYKIVEMLSNSASKYKLQNMGEALVWEYLRNVGIDGAKPDVHLRRFLGGSRMGGENHSPATNEEVYRTVLDISKQTGLSMAEIDMIIWMYCAEGYGGVCGASPKCYLCPLKECSNRKS